MIQFVTSFKHDFLPISSIKIPLFRLLSSSLKLITKKCKPLSKPFYINLAKSIAYFEICAFPI